MYPFESRLRWWVQGRQGHLVAALARDPLIAAGTHTEAIAMLLMRLRRWLGVRLGLLILLSMGIIAGILTFLLRALPRMAEVEAGLSLIITISTSLASLLGLLYLLVNRTLGQLEIDVMLLIHLTRAESAENANSRTHRAKRK